MLTIVKSKNLDLTKSIFLKEIFAKSHRGLLFGVSAVRGLRHSVLKLSDRQKGMNILCVS